MLIQREHVMGNNKTFTVINTDDGEAFTINSLETQNYHDKVSKIQEDIKRGDSYETIYKEYILSNDESTLKSKYGIRIGKENLIISKDFIGTDKDMMLPKRMASIFKDVKTEEDLKKFALFTQLLAKNPYEHSKESLIDWIVKNPVLKILDDGRIQGYRGVAEDYHSYNSGYGIVNGVEYEYARLDNTPGNIIEFPSAMIDHNPKNICSVGLHIGTLGYARGYGSIRLLVAFSPEHVVSFPYDSEQSKIRVSKMEILEEITNIEQFLINMDMKEEVSK